MPHLLSVWSSVEQRLEAVSRVLLFLDYDGTLTPIVSRPELARLSPETRYLLQELNSHQKYVVGVISGRDLRDVQRLVDVPELIYAGNHGLEIQSVGEHFLYPAAEASQEALSQLRFKLENELNEYPGVIVEDKGLTLSVHFRLTPDDMTKQVEAGFRKIVSGVTGFRITMGKKVLEVRPDVEWDKGKAIGMIIDRYSDGGLPIYMGDDQTDEAGFEVVQERGGIAVFVGEARQPTRALYRVDSPAEVAQALNLMSRL